MGARSTPDVYSPSSGDVTISGATAIQEFFGFVGDCGEAAGEILYAWSQGKAPSGAHINAVVSAMQKAGLAGNQGVSSASEESKFLASEGVANYTTNNIFGALKANAGIHPVELLVNAPNLGADLPGDEYGVHGHFITVEGWSPTKNAYVVSDPDNAAAKQGKLVFYTPGQLASANPITAIVASGPGKGIAGGIGTAAGSVGAAASGVGNALSSAADLPGAIAALPGNLVAAFQADIINAGFLFFAAMLMLIGVLLLIGPQAVDATKQAAKAAAVAE